MAIVKKREVEVMAELSNEELVKYMKKLPATKEQFEGLFDFLETRLEMTPCDHTSRYSMQYLMQKMMSFPKVSGWLSLQGGYCDCRIVENIAIPWREIFADKEDI